MSPIRIDPGRCRKDGFCTQICQKVFSQESKDSVPIIANQNLCNVCGHCLLICPAGAITLEDCDTKEIHSINTELLPSYDSVREMIVARRSTRTFQDKPVPKDIIAKVIDGAQFAPSAKNTQSTEYIVVQDPALLGTLATETAKWLGKTAAKLENPLVRKLYLLFGEGSAEQMARWTGQFNLIASKMAGGNDLVLFNAPALILFHADKRITFAEANANLAFQNASMIASSLGIGHFYTGYLVAASLRNKTIGRLLDLPDKHVLYAGLAVGYSRIRFSKWIERNPAKVTWK